MLNVRCINPALAIAGGSPFQMDITLCSPISTAMGGQARKVPPAETNQWVRLFIHPQRATDHLRGLGQVRASIMVLDIYICTGPPAWSISSSATQGLFRTVTLDELIRAVVDFSKPRARRSRRCRCGWENIYRARGPPPRSHSSSDVFVLPLIV